MQLSDQAVADVLRDLRIFIDNELGAPKMADRLWYSYENQSQIRFLNRLHEQCSLILELIYQLRLAIIEVKLKTAGGRGLDLPSDEHSSIYTPEDAAGPEDLLSAASSLEQDEGERVKFLRSLALSEIASIYQSLHRDMAMAFSALSSSPRVLVVDEQGGQAEHPHQTYLDQAIRVRLLRLGLLKPGDALSQRRFQEHYLPVAIQHVFEVLLTIRPGAPRPYPDIAAPYHPPVAGLTAAPDQFPALSSEDRLSLRARFDRGAAARGSAGEEFPLLSSVGPFLHSRLDAPAPFCYNLAVSLRGVVPEALVRVDHRVCPLVLDVATPLLRVAHAQYLRIKKARAQRASLAALHDVNHGTPLTAKYPANLFVIVSAAVVTAGSRREWWSVTEPRPLGADADFDVPLVTKYLPRAAEIARMKALKHVLSDDGEVVAPLDVLELQSKEDAKERLPAAADDAPADAAAENIYTDQARDARVAASRGATVDVCAPAVRLAVHVVRLTTATQAAQRALPHNRQTDALTPLLLHADGTAKRVTLPHGVAADELDGAEAQDLCLEVVGTLGGVDDVFLASIMNTHTMTAPRPRADAAAGPAAGHARRPRRPRPQRRHLLHLRRPQRRPLARLAHAHARPRPRRGLGRRRGPPPDGPLAAHHRQPPPRSRPMRPRRGPQRALHHPAVAAVPRGHHRPGGCAQGQRLPAPRPLHHRRRPRRRGGQRRLGWRMLGVLRGALLQVPARVRPEARRRVRPAVPGADERQALVAARAQGP
jgi:hypothetical protein